MSGKPAARQGDMTQYGGSIVQGSAGVRIGSGPARRTTTPGRTKSVSASSINIPLRRLINVTESATTRFSPLECTGKCVSSFSYC